MKIASQSLKALFSLCLVAAPLSAQVSNASSGSGRSNASPSVQLPDESGRASAPVSNTDPRNRQTRASARNRNRQSFNEAKPISRRILNQPTIAQQSPASSADPKEVAARAAQSMPNAELYGKGYAGALGVPSLTYAGHLLPGHTVDFFVENTAGKKTFGFVLMGFQPRNMSFRTGATILVNANIATQRVQLAPGRNVFPWAIPHDILMHGSEVYVQVLVNDNSLPGKFSMSRGLKLSL